jgi:hypothetical protein
MVLSLDDELVIDVLQRQPLAPPESRLTKRVVWSLIVWSELGTCDKNLGIELRQITLEKYSLTMNDTFLMIAGHILGISYIILATRNGIIRLLGSDTYVVRLQLCLCPP